MFIHTTCLMYIYIRFYEIVIIKTLPRLLVEMQLYLGSYTVENYIH